VAYQAMVDHNRRVMLISFLYDGRECDKTITVKDEFTYGVMMGKLKDAEFDLHNENGELMRCKGEFSILNKTHPKFCLL